MAWPALAAIVLFYLLRLTSSANTFSQTVDEPYHLGAAVAIYDARAHVLGVQHPPLPRLVAGLPMRLLGADLPEYRGQQAARREDAAYEAGSKVLFARDGAWYWQVLTAGRLAMLIFPAVALLYAFLLGRYLVDDRAGLAAALLLSLDATLLGHGLWLCTDAPAAAGFLAAIYHGLRWINAPTLPRAAWAGIAGGLGVACKFSAALALPGLLLVLAAYTVLRRRRPPFWRITGHLSLIVAIAFVTLWATYLFHIGPMGPSDTLASAPQWDRLPAVVKDTPIPMPAFFLGLGRLAAHSAGGHTTYFLGHLSNRGSPAYFPVLIAAKTPIALLAAMIIGVMMGFERKSRSTLLLCGVLIPAGLFLLISAVGGIQIGIRHILPAIALLYLPAGVVLTRSRLRIAGLALLAIVAGAETLGHHPDYLSFYNRAAGGPAAGPRIALDSNTDWGQDLGRLARTLRSDPSLPLTAIYPLGDPRHLDRTAALFRILEIDEDLLDPPTLPPPGTLIAISRTRLAMEADAFLFLKGATEVGRVGDGIAIYRVPDDSAGPP